MFEYPEDSVYEEEGVSNEEFITRQVSSCQSILNGLNKDLSKPSNKDIEYETAVYHQIMSAMEEQDTFICSYTMKLMALCENHIQLIRNIKFKLNQQKMALTLKNLVKNQIKKMPEIPIEVEKDMAAMFELSLMD